MLKRLYQSTAVVTLMLALCMFCVPQTAQAEDVLLRVCNDRPNASVCKDKNPNPGDNNPLFGADGIITSIIDIISILIGIAAVVIIVMAGMKFVTSGSNPQEVSAAREMIIYAIVGLVLAASAQIIVRFVLVRIFS